MKRTLLLIGLFAFTYVAAHAQRRVNERDLTGVWKLVIDVDKDEVREEIEDEDNIVAQIFAETVTDFAFNIIEKIDIRFEFLPDNRLRVEANVFGESEVEYSEWRINKDGELWISDSDHFKVDDDDDDFWLMENGKLVSFEKQRDGSKRNKSVYLEPVK
ncbi:hypothetical protein RT717_04320 [Imperialibacter roseus]|uniref:Lipocalin-like domain-containing protein n=1 Tax=Imperialibacter roseus TaxID=1324217 RepID=A0ABZ0IVY7_9BACT|nr:hypothetical protein [Imperialibacter roseus]WOK07851.1 hypothetical protein RT717_04320 [Imperialibacter roseus]